MDFRTQVKLPEKRTEIQHSESIMLFGSCFAENIGNMLLENKFQCDVNPFGVLYNPLSISKALQQIIEGKHYTASDLFEANGAWHSWMHHSAFSHIVAEECLLGINARLERAVSTLKYVDWLFITWGTAYVYALQETGEIVGNCHKQPDRLFTRKLLTVSDVVQTWNKLLEQLYQVNPHVKLLFTVSPIRHVKDGMHGNQLSKSTLLLAVNELCERWDNCYYFPSYEIMLDELRDYRFYAEDMVHLSPLAIKYIWKCFSDAYFSETTCAVMKEWESIRKGLEHKPFNSETEAYRNFLSQIVLKINRIKEKFPYFEVQKELEQCLYRLK
ncbi:MAG: GSCFA domain-containing protein [Bacteroidaceae bacterium]|nr:GSCFA domain-containing protein [Bacteroidaceae bacterium]